MRRRGFTLIELAVSVTIITGILLLVSTTLDATASATRFDLARNDAMSAARKITQQVTRELSASGGHQGGADHCNPARSVGAVGSTTITFAMRGALTGTEATDWGTPIIYRLVANGDTAGDNDDDDKDGVWDERRLEREQDGETVTMDESVTAFAIDRAVGGDMITITVEVSRGVKTKGLVTAPNDWVRARMVTNVYLRNRV